MRTRHFFEAQRGKRQRAQRRWRGAPTPRCHGVIFGADKNAPDARSSVILRDARRRNTMRRAQRIRRHGAENMRPTSRLRDMVAGEADARAALKPCSLRRDARRRGAMLFVCALC